MQREKEDNHNKTELLPPGTFFNFQPWGDFMGADLGLPYQEVLFMTGKELRDIGDHRVRDTYMTLRGYPGTLTDQNSEQTFLGDTNKRLGIPIWEHLLRRKELRRPEELKPWSSGHNFVFPGT